MTSSGHLSTRSDIRKHRLPTTQLVSSLCAPRWCVHRFTRRVHMSGAEVAGPAAEQRRPRATEVEQHGTDTTPDAERSSRLFDLFRIQFGRSDAHTSELQSR